MSFGDVKDQAVPVRLLRSVLRRNRIPNGLLFWGPGGVGKRMAAMEMAKAINCAEGGDDACDVCLSCRKIASSNHPDVRVVAPLAKARVIKVNAIEVLNEFAALRAFESRWRVFVLLDADRMNLPAQNHFLKTLEEPPGNSLFILVSEFPRLLLPTIRSRCQQVRFGALRPETVIEILIRERSLGAREAESIAALSQGQVSRALDLVDTEKREAALDVTGRLAAGEDPMGVAEAFSKHLKERKSQIATSIQSDADHTTLAEASSEDKQRIQEEETARIDADYRREIMGYLYLFETWYRDAALYRIDPAGPHVFNSDQPERLAAMGAVNLGDKIAAIEKARLYLERFIHEGRVFRDLFFALAQ